MVYDLIIVGTGPAGLSAAAHAQKEGLSVLLLEQGRLANTIFNYQKKKHVMAEPAIIPLRSDLAFEAGSREAILETWEAAVKDYKIQLHQAETVHEIAKKGRFFEVRSDKSSYEAVHVVLAIGIQGNPNRLGKPGEFLAHVSYHLLDPFIYENEDIMMVGSGEAAIEGVLALCDKNRVTVINREREFFRLKPALDRQITDKLKTKQIVAYHNATVERFEPGYAKVNLPDEVITVKTDRVFVRIGASLPRPFLEKCGVIFESEQPNALPLLSERYEATVPGLYVIGAAAGCGLIKEGINQGYEVVEYILGRQIEPAEDVFLREKITFYDGPLSGRLKAIAKTVPLLANVNQRGLRELLLQSTIHRVSPQQEVYRENDFTYSLFLIVNGRVKVNFRAGSLGDRPITLKAGGFFGELSLLSGRRRSETVVALTTATLIEIPRKSLLRLMANEPAVKEFLDKTYINWTLRTHLLPDMRKDLAQELAEKAQVRTFKKDEVIIKQGQVGDAFYLIRAGSVKLIRRDGQKDTMVKYLPAGKYFGETALLDVDDRTVKATVVATTRTEVIQLMNDDFWLLMKRHPEYQQKLRADMQEMRIAGQALQVMETKGPAIVNRMLQKGVFEGTDILLIDAHKCIRCDNCVKACASTHGGDSCVTLTEGSVISQLIVPSACRHCENPLCLTDCPPGDAIKRDARGIVYINEDKCIGCGNCAVNCPYGSITMRPRNPDRSVWSQFLTGVGLAKAATPAIKAVKCDLCREDAAGPACVRSCPTGAAIRVHPAEYFAAVGAGGPLGGMVGGSEVELKS